jgi:DNA-binding SARP family transcriptional activator
MAHLSLALLGPFQATLDGLPITAFESAKVRALLAYLAVEGERPHPRAALAGLLWPDWPERSALANLRYALANLREAIGDRAATPPFLLISRESLQFNTESDHDLDVRCLTALRSAAAADVARLEEVVALYRGPFLDEFALSDAAPFEEWLTLQREHLAQQLGVALRRLVAGCEGRGDLDAAQRHARRAVELAPLDEVAQRQLMRALALGGQRSAALAQYESCRRVLQQELGVEPARETTALYERIRQGLLGELPRPTLPVSVPIAPPARERAPFVAREKELARLNGSLEAALGGEGRVALVVGEPGSGKTMLLHEFARQAMAECADLIVVGGNCNAYTGVGDPYLPFLEVLGLLTGDIEARLASGTLSSEHAQRLQRNFPATVQALLSAGPDLVNVLVPGEALLARAQLWGASSAPWQARLEAVAQRQGGAPSQTALFEQVTRVLQALAREHPLLLFLDDLQWADSGSLNLLFHLGRKLSGSRILVLGAYRAEEVALGRNGERHPLDPIVSEFRRTWGEIVVDMAQAEGRALVEALVDGEPNRLGGTFRELLHRHTGGHALFTVEVLRELRARGDLRRDEDGAWVEGPGLLWERLPARVEAVIGESIARLTEEERVLLEVASVEGEEFTAEAVARAGGMTEAEVIQRLSGSLSHAHALVRAQSVQRAGEQRLSRYRFRHILFQRYLYRRLDEVERSAWHERVGQAIEALWVEQREEVLGVLAWHYQEAGVVSFAVDYLEKAALRAHRMRGFREAMDHLSRAVALIRTLPENRENAITEMRLLGSLMRAIGDDHEWRGTDIVEHASRMGNLAEKWQHLAGQITALQCLALHHLYLSEFAEHHEVAEEMLRLAQASGDAAVLFDAHLQMAHDLLSATNWAAARDHYELALSASQQPGEQRSFGILELVRKIQMLYNLAFVHWILGYPDQARRIHAEGRALAPRLLADEGSPLGITLGTWSLHLRRETELLREDVAWWQRYTADRPLQVYRTDGPVWIGWGLMDQGHIAQGVAMMRQGIAEGKALGDLMPNLRIVLVDGLLGAGQADEALAVLDETVALLERAGRTSSHARLYRSRGDAHLLRMRNTQSGTRVDDARQAEIWLRKSIALLRSQQAKMPELRATLSLARLLREQGRGEEARAILGAIYGWFTEGFDTPDLVEARELLEELA